MDIVRTDFGARGEPETRTVFYFAVGSAVAGGEPVYPTMGLNDRLGAIEGCKESWQDHAGDVDPR